MPVRNPAEDEALLVQQYERLRDAVEGFYAGKEVQALNVAITLRVLVHETPSKSKSLLSRLNPDYWHLTIFHIVKNLRIHKVGRGKMVFAVHVPFSMGGSGDRLTRPEFDPRMGYRKVRLKNWWNDDYQPLFGKFASKRQIILDVADTDGGAHVDSKVTESHAMLSKPPFQFGTEGATLIRPNLAYGTVAQCGYEMQEYLERNFPFVRQ